MGIATQHSITKWRTIRAAILQMKCPLCEEYKTKDSCGKCPISTGGNNCAKEYLDIHTAINNFIKLLEHVDGN